MNRTAHRRRLFARLLGLLTILVVFPTESDAQARWLLSAEPTLVIGSADGPLPHTFHDIRGAVTAADGSIVVADGGSSELRVFSPAGEFLRLFGREGDGPREFRRIGWIDRCGGEAIVAYDSHRYRITAWGTDGALLDEFAIEGPTELPPYEVSCGGSGRFVVVGWPDVFGMPPGAGPYRPSVTIGIADERGRRERVIGSFPGYDRIRTEHNDRPHPFGRSTTATIGPGGVYVGTADSFAIHLVTADGERRTFGRDHAMEPLSPRMRERWIDAYIREAPEDRRPSLKRQLLASEWVPAVAPAYAGLRIDRLGFVWVEPYVVGDPAATGPVEWSVFDGDGDFVGTVHVPATFRPMEIGEGHVLGVSTDVLGVERVHRYILSR